MSIQPISKLLNDPTRNIRFDGEDLLTKKGYTLVPNHALTSSKISPGGKLAYVMLLKYAWYNDMCFPGQETLATDMGSGERSVRRYLHELEQAKFITIKRQGQGKPNLYILHIRVDKQSGGHS